MAKKILAIFHIPGKSPEISRTFCARFNISTLPSNWPMKIYQLNVNLYDAHNTNGGGI